MRNLISLALISLSSAATWYGIAPDEQGIPGIIELFEMDSRGNYLRDIAIIPTRDDEYPKEGTLQCSWENDSWCIFLSGVGGRYIQDAVWQVDRTNGRVINRELLPPGIFADDLVFDWLDGNKAYSIAYNPQDRHAYIVQFNVSSPSVVLNITLDLEGGFPFPGSLTYCVANKFLFVSVAMNFRIQADFILAYDLSGATPKLANRIPIFFPAPAIHAFCNSTHFQDLMANTIFSASQDRESVVLGSLVAPNAVGFLLEQARGDLPPINDPARGQLSLHLTGMFSEFGGEFLVPVYPPFERGPGPRGGFFGFVWSDTVTGNGAFQTFNRINYFLAGAAGVPGR